MDDTKKAVRFAAASTVSFVDVNNATKATTESSHSENRPGKKRKLEKNDHRMNEDELDDIDEWNPDDDPDDDDNTISVSDRNLREAKSQRRIKRVIGDDDHDDVDTSTRIDNRTSLAAEGYEIEPFNMDQERNDGSGYFDGDTYIFRKRNDEDDEPDAWVDSLNDASTKTNGDEKNSDSDIRHGRIIMQREELRRRQVADDIDDRMDNWSEGDLYAKLLPHLEGNETVMGALIRYGQKFQVKNSNKSNSKINVAATSNDTEIRQVAQDSFNVITEAANALLLKGKIDIYETKKVDIEAIVKSKLQVETTSAVIPSDSVAPNCSKNAVKVQWEYQGNQDGEIHGPFSTEEMLGWVNAGYFVGSMAVQVRSITHQPTLAATSDKTIKEDLLSDLLDDDDDNTIVQPPDQQIVQRGEWILSDEVDFHKHT